MCIGSYVYYFLIIIWVVRRSLYHIFLKYICRIYFVCRIHSSFVFVRVQIISTYQFFPVSCDFPLSACFSTLRRLVQRAEAQAFADDNGLLYVEASAKSAEGVDGWLSLSHSHSNLCFKWLMAEDLYTIDAFIRTAESVWEKQKQGGFQRRNSNLGDDVRTLAFVLPFYNCTYVQNIIYFG